MTALGCGVEISTQALAIRATPLHQRLRALNSPLSAQIIEVFLLLNNSSLCNSLKSLKDYQLDLASYHKYRNHGQSR